jgi:hypothetical protein
MSVETEVRNLFAGVHNSKKLPPHSTSPESPNLPTVPYLLSNVLSSDSDTIAPAVHQKHLDFMNYKKGNAQSDHSTTLCSLGWP